jgi:hypothetical protein
LPEPIVFNDNGAWSWYEDERAVVDEATGTLLVSTVADDGGTGGTARAGNVEVVAYNLATGTTRRTVLHAGLQADDHNSAALFVRPDGRYVAMYSRHETDRLTRWRVSRRGGDAVNWSPERHLEHDAVASYSNVYPAVDEGGEMLVAFVRGTGRDPRLLVSRDDGTTWRHGGRLLDGPGRPYVRYAADTAGRIHVLVADQHPDEFASSIFHGVVAGSRLLRSDGAVADPELGDEEAVAPQQLTMVFPGDTARRAWTIDVQVDTDGRPYAAFSVSTRASGHRYYYARFDGSDWRSHFLAHAGSALTANEPSYTGLVALDPADPSRVFISTDADPVTGAPLISAGDDRRHHELFEGVSTDGGTTWTWTAVTADSTADNIRPIVPVWDADHTAVLWLRGSYTGYHDYDLDVVGLVTEHDTKTAADEGTSAEVRAAA